MYPIIIQPLFIFLLCQSFGNATKMNFYKLALELDNLLIFLFCNRIIFIKSDIR